MHKMSITQMEGVQTIVWTIAIVILIVAALIAWWVWEISKRASRKKQSKPVK